MKDATKSFVYWLVGLTIVAITSWLVYSNPPSGSEVPKALAYSEFVAQANKHKIKAATIKGHSVSGSLVDGKLFTTTVPDATAAANRLVNDGVQVDVTATEEGSWLLALLAGLLPWVLLIGIYYMVASRVASGGGRTFGFGKSRARLLAPDQRTRITLADVAGIDEAKQELSEIVEFLKYPAKFQRLGGKIPKGCLLIGPPGSGKTLLARAIAGEADVPFFTISGSDFVEMFVGVGASRVRDLFEQAKISAPCIVFIDEIDAVGRRRGVGLGPTNDEREQTLNQLLVEMDGFDTKEGVILLAATNRPDVLDPALLRPGRFDRQIALSNPDILGREQILKVHLRGVPLTSDVDAKVVARGTPGFSGADLANLVNEAALLAARRNRDAVSMAEFEDAKDKVMMGAERRSMVMTAKEKETTAFHEAGHALVTMNMPAHDPLHKVTIIPHGRAMGATLSLPERDRYGFARKELEAKLAILFGGRVAEELIFGPDNLTTGATDDIKQATKLARRMITEFGFSEKLGPLCYGGEDRDVLAEYGFGRRMDISEDTAKLIDSETRSLVEQSETKARTILSSHISQLKLLAAALLESETLSGEQIEQLLSRKAA